MDQETSYERLLTTVHKTVFLVDRFADRLLAETKSGTFSQFLVMMAVHRHPGLSQSDVAHCLNLTPAAVSRQIDSLVDSRLIVRAEDPKSRRTHTVRLTKAGDERLIAMKSLLLKSFRERMGSIAPLELDAAEQVLHKILVSIEPEYAEHEKTLSAHKIR